MKSKIVERLCNGYYIKYLEIECEGCKHKLYYAISMLKYCTAFYCHYCGTYISTKEFLKKKKKLTALVDSYCSK